MLVVGSYYCGGGSKCRCVYGGVGVSGSSYYGGSENSGNGASGVVVMMV